MRLAAYAGASTVLAIGIVLRAFHERPNFYSASVYLAQSSACRMILLNLLLLSAYGLVRTLQKLLYGPLRAIEREQLWDKAWYAVTETALAMTTFRDEVGAWFFVMFICLLAGKIWGWISEARVEALEQQPPANPRLYHIRLIISLLLSEFFDGLMLRYCIVTLIEQPRPGMMVMFAFEFAVLAITSTSTALKYVLAMQEKLIIKRQTKVRLEERRLEIRTAREESQRQAPNTGASEEGVTATTTNIESEADIDENEIDVPGWQEKGRWMLFLDLMTDFLKLLVYMCFFTILLMFHGIPIHIIRDVFLTTRSFLKRISDFLKYRNATKDMNTRYPDATQEELARDGTCIICREEMRPWVEPNQPPAGPPGTRRPDRMLLDERQRPKKLPCGHILHFGCLRSWLERQQVCPTCRSSVLTPSVNTNSTANRPQLPGQQAQGGAAGAANPLNANRPVIRPNPRRARTFNVAGWRFAWAAGNEREVREALNLAQENDNAPPGQAGSGIREIRDRTNTQNGTIAIAEALGAIRANHATDTPASMAYHRHITRLEEQIMREIQGLNLAAEQLAVVRALQQQLAALRLPSTASTATGPVTAATSNMPRVLSGIDSQQMMPVQFAPDLYHSRHNVGIPQPGHQVFESLPEQTPLGPGSPDLPTGFTLPQGWTLLPLQSNEDNMPQTQIQNPNLTDLSYIEDVLAQVPFNTIAGQTHPEAQAGPSSQHATLANPHQGYTGTATEDIDTNVDSPNTVAQNWEPTPNASSETSTLAIPTPSSNPIGIDSATTSEQQPQNTPSIPNWSQVGPNWGPTPSSSLSSSSTLSSPPQLAGSAESPSNDANGGIENDSSDAKASSPSTQDKGKQKATAVTVEDVHDEDEQ